MKSTHLLPALIAAGLLLGACRSAPSRASDTEGIAGAYAGSCDAGKGRLDLRPDGTFELWLHFADFECEWRAKGRWRRPSWEAEAQGASFVELVVRDFAAALPPESEFAIPEDQGSESPDDPVLLATVTSKEAVVGGPCITFILPRLR